MLIPKEKTWEVHEAGVDYFSDDFMDDRIQPKADRRNGL